MGQAAHLGRASGSYRQPFETSQGLLRHRARFRSGPCLRSQLPIDPAVRPRRSSYSLVQGHLETFLAHARETLRRPAPALRRGRVPGIPPLRGLRSRLPSRSLRRLRTRFPRRLLLQAARPLSELRRTAHGQLRGSSRRLRAAGRTRTPMGALAPVRAPCACGVRREGLVCARPDFFGTPSRHSTSARRSAPASRARAACERAPSRSSSASAEAST